jgi:antitoxin component of MazEF toxin-antitoxin module
MTKTIRATFDGQVLRPDEPLPLRPNTRVLITLTTDEKPRPGFTLEELLAGVTKENVHAEVDTGPAVGNEAW